MEKSTIFSIAVLYFIKNNMILIKEKKRIIGIIGYRFFFFTNIIQHPLLSSKLLKNSMHLIVHFSMFNCNFKK